MNLICLLAFPFICGCLLKLWKLNAYTYIAGASTLLQTSALIKQYKPIAPKPAATSENTTVPARKYRVACFPCPIQVYVVALFLHPQLKLLVNM